MRPNPFYALAKQYFDGNGSTVVDAPSGGQTIEGILADLKARTALQETDQHRLPAHRASAPSRLPTHARRARPPAAAITTADDMPAPDQQDARARPGRTSSPKTTRVVLYGGDLGRSTNFLLLLVRSVRQPRRVAGPAAPGRVQAGRIEPPSIDRRRAGRWSARHR